MSDFLTVGKILDADDIEYREIEIPQWGGKVFIKTLSGDERDRVEQMSMKFARGEMTGYSAEIAVMVVCDKDKKPLFKAADLPRLRAKSGAALKAIFEAVNQQNNLIPEAVQAAAKN